jgi:hypothetical protein
MSTLEFDNISDGTTSVPMGYVVNGSAKAWMSLNGDTATIRNSQNVSSITDNGVGDYTTNFSNNMDNANYAVLGSCSGAGSVNGSLNTVQINSNAHNSLSAPTTSSFRTVAVHHGNSANQDVDYLMITVHGDLAP